MKSVPLFISDENIFNEPIRFEICRSDSSFEFLLISSTWFSKIIPDHPEIQKEKAYYDSNTPVPWVRIFWVPDFVFFNHIPHVKWAGFDCSQCHGDVKTMDRLQLKKFKMNFCITCHRENKAQVDCWLACHR